jgi:hypothetical protein
MNDNDYTIRPLQGPATVSGLNPANSREGQKKRRDSRKRSAPRGGTAGGMPDVPADIAEDRIDEADEPHIDYCA